MDCEEIYVVQDEIQRGVGELGITVITLSEGLFDFCFQKILSNVSVGF